MSRTIYFVSSGEYSDYGVDAVAETKELAEAAVAAGVGYRVEEGTLLTSTDDIVKKHVFQATVDAQGTVKNLYEYDEFAWKGFKREARLQRFGERVFGCVASSDRSFEHAIQMARDLLTAYQAEQAGF